MTAELLHFGGAADQLRVTQQALSKRIRRLEDLLRVPLFVRDTRHVRLTAAGHQFLPYAKELVSTADSAVRALCETTTRLRVDVLDDRLASLRLVQRALAERPELRAEISMRRSLLAALSAMERGEIDVALGRIHDLGRSLPAQISHTLVRLEPIRVLVGDDHPLAGATALRPMDLARAGLWSPNRGSAEEWDTFLIRFASDFNLSLDFEEGAATLGGLASRIRDERHRVMLTGADMPLPDDTGLRTIPLVEPEPVYPWSLIWHRNTRRLTEGFVDAAIVAGNVPRRAGGAPAPDLAGQWLPAPDRMALTGH